MKFDKEYLLPLGRFVMKNDQVCLIRTQYAAGDPERNWAATEIYAICLPEKIPFRGYEVAGRCDLRLGFNRQLYYGGNIGYRIFEPYRGHHLALEAAKLLLERAEKKKMPYVIITCNPDNHASRRTLEHLQEEHTGTLLETVDLPPDNDMYQQGERRKCIFYYPLEEGVGTKVLANGNFEAFPHLTEFRPTVEGGKRLILPNNRCYPES